MKADAFCRFHDDRTIGYLSKTNPIQSSFFAAAFNTADISIWKDTIDYNSSENIDFELSLASIDWQRVEDVHKSSRIPSEVINSSGWRPNIYPSSIGEALEFANDISIAVQSCRSNILKKNDAKNSNSHIEHPPCSNLPVKRNSETMNVDSSSTIQQNGKFPNLSKTFKSAKEQFKQEGGQISALNNNFNEKGSSKNAVNQPSSNQASATHPLLANCEKELVEKIEAEIIHNGQNITFEDISGLEFAKKCVTELICWPMARPDLFCGIRAVPKGLLLFGPPGTGKTLIGKAIAHQTAATFFNISASSLMSKWIGEGEKLVRTLFAVAAAREPSVVFIDEVDSLLCQRSAEENEASRRMKTEFMVQLDGAGTPTSEACRVVVVGATNRPEELDEAVRRRFAKRLYIPLPDQGSRRGLIKNLLKDNPHCISEEDLDYLVHRTDQYSGADIRVLCTEAAMGPMRQLTEGTHGDLRTILRADVPAISREHFESAIDTVQPSVSPEDLQRYVLWNSSFGSFRRMT